MTRHTARLMLSGVATVTSVFALLTLPSPSPGHLPDEPEMGLRTERSGRGREAQQRFSPTTKSVTEDDLPPHRYADPPVAHVHASGGATVSSGSVWDRLAACESGGDWAINTGNGYFGGLQHSESTWLAFGGGEFAPYAHQATREQQIAVAERVLAGQGWANAWPSCSRQLGLR